MQAHAREVALRVARCHGVHLIRLASASLERMSVVAKECKAAVAIVCDVFMSSPLGCGAPSTRTMKNGAPQGAVC